MNNLDFHTFYFELPLYTKIKLTGDVMDDFVKLIEYNHGIDAYNPTLKENTTYSVRTCRINNQKYFFQYGGHEYSELTCVRTSETIYVYYYFDRQEATFQKIGQYPSIADFHISQIKEYDKVLSKENLKEFTRAIGLAANGVGIGSFVYLRRIFEDLIEEAHIKAKGQDGWNEEEYVNQRMNDKIGLLENYLPQFLVENKSLYGILSTGIHSLKEQECLAYFETVKVGIELILDEKVEEYKKQEKLKAAKSKIANLSGELKKK